ncbi:MAG: MerR family transcriptional regulator [Nocardioidaceae bacterium]|nr:MerR family transcriptional regulator [Nocardioidaceae bacterium]
MRIGALAKALGTTPESVRFYERRGLLPGPSRKASGYRDYGPAEADRLRLLLGLRQLDLPLDEAARLATLCADGHCKEVSDDLRRSLPAQRSEVRRRIAELRHLEARLTDLERNLTAGAEPRPLISGRTDDSDGSPSTASRAVVTLKKRRHAETNS